MLFNEENIKTQTILLTLQGKLISSCNSLFESQPLAPYPGTQGIPLVESILDTFTNQFSTKLHIPRIETNYPDLPGFYDFTFEAVQRNNRTIIRWIIYDFTKVYQALQRKQQTSHNKAINNNLGISQNSTNR